MSPKSCAACAAALAAVQRLEARVQDLEQRPAMATPAAARAASISAAVATPGSAGSSLVAAATEARLQEWGARLATLEAKVRGPKVYGAKG